MLLRASSSRSLLAIGGFAVVYAGLALSVSNSYYQSVLALVPVWAVLALAWNIISGYGGLVSFGHAAFFGIGAYVVGLGFEQFGIPPSLGLILAGLAGAGAGALIGSITLPLRGHYFALAMLAYPLAFLNLMNWLGFQEVVLPVGQKSNLLTLHAEDPRVETLIALFFLIIALLVCWAIEHSRMGLSLVAIREDESAAEAAGIDARRVKLLALTISGAMAAVTGGIYAIVLVVVTPAGVFGLNVSAQALVLTLFGGAATLWGPVIGALVLIPLATLLNGFFGSVLPGLQGIVFGVAIVAVILVAPEGLYWLVRDALGRRGGSAIPPEKATGPIVTGHRANLVGEVLLEVDGVEKSFGGVRAIAGVSFSIERGELVGILGPNGAGKTTLFDLLSGFVRPDAGGMRFCGQSIVGLRPYQICRLGIGRTFQTPRAFARLSVLDNVIAGALGATSDDASARQRGWSALERTGLVTLAGTLAGDLVMRDLRFMEIARALAADPVLMLLDEPLAGLGGPEIEDVLSVLSAINASGIAICIIDHTIHAMTGLVDRFIVLDRGKQISTGTPRAVMQDPVVIEAYLGRRHHVPA
jgi:ABC-type branched-subunit amino acid transport system ATPase component/ABC-type branched-subunit amino acid transport system permease subunit